MLLNLWHVQAPAAHGTGRRQAEVSPYILNRGLGQAVDLSPHHDDIGKQAGEMCERRLQARHQCEGYKRAAE